MPAKEEHGCNSGSESLEKHEPRGDANLSLLQEVVTHVTELCKPPYCMTIFVCPRFVLIMMLSNFVDIALSFVSNRTIHSYQLNGQLRVL
jgi:hypothetical protein